ncbi:MAG: hypothetical protein ACD_33C00008G0004 [uncultured bacterium]|nr:MAG: hypothetical protein ACD_33C00008G0004 [uncultured bacterium]
MLTPVQIKQILIDNLNSNLQYSTQLFLTNLITRNDVNCGLNLLRIKDITDNLYITDLADLIANLDESFMTIEVGNNFVNSDTVHSALKPVIITLENLEVELYTNANIDSNFNSSNLLNIELTKSNVVYPVEKYVKKIMFVLNYLNDADTVTPIKIVNTLLK